MSAQKTIGQLAIVLHTHMPQVIGHGVWPFGEQWLWEVFSGSYLRTADAVRGYPVTIGVTPVLASQLAAMRGEPGDRFIDWVEDTREYVFGEDMAAFPKVGRPELTEALEPQLADYRSATERFTRELGRDACSIFGDLALRGAELMGGPLTHPILALLATDFGLDLQLSGGMREHAGRFGPAQGIWLPECAWKRGLDTALARHGVEYFCVDQSSSLGEVALENLEPVRTPAGPLAIPIDWHTIAQVWREDGYPAAGPYRSTFARTIHDLMPYDNTGGAWNPARARAQAEADADRFLRALAARLEVFADERGRPGCSVFAADTELFGHWWYEGPWWLQAVLTRAADYGIELVTLGQVARDSVASDRPLATSTWGKNKTFETWDSPRVASIVWRQRRAELELEAASRNGGDLAEATSELAALQASDWAFMESGGRTGDYGERRFAGHLASFEQALEQASG